MRGSLTLREIHEKRSLKLQTATQFKWYIQYVIIQLVCIERLDLFATLAFCVTFALDLEMPAPTSMCEFWKWCTKNRKISCTLNLGVTICCYLQWMALLMIFKFNTYENIRIGLAIMVFSEVQHSFFGNFVNIKGTYRLAWYMEKEITFMHLSVQISIYAYNRAKLKYADWSLDKATLITAVQSIYKLWFITFLISHFR